MNGRECLKKLIADVLGASSRVSPNRPEICGVAIGLVAAGALPQEGAEQILADLDESLKRTGLHLVTRVEKLNGGSGSGVTHVRIESPAWTQTIGEPPSPVLRHVVPLGDRSVAIGDMVGNLVSLEVWSSFLVLRLACACSDPSQLWARPGPVRPLEGVGRRGDPVPRRRVGV